MKIRVNAIVVEHDTVHLKVPPDASEQLSSVQKYVSEGKDVTVEFKRQKRSRDANSYCWVLCQKMADKMNSSKEDVYRHAIRQMGNFTPMPIRKEAVERFKEIWAEHGIGWVVDVLGDSKLKGYVTVAAYHGSSTYDTQEMSRLIDFLVEEAKSMGIQTRPQEEIDALLKEWGM